MAAVESEVPNSAKNTFFCHHCEKDCALTEVFLWSVCNHRYCRECAFNGIIKQIFNQTYPYCIATKNDEIKTADADEDEANICREALLNSDATLILTEEYYDAFLNLLNARQEADLSQSNNAEMKRNDNDNDNDNDNEIEEKKNDNNGNKKDRKDRKNIKYDKTKQFICDYCSNGTKIHEIETRFYWSECKHEMSQECASGAILEDLLNGKLPLCPIDNCSKILTEDDASIVLENDFFVIYSALYKNYLIAHGIIPADDNNPNDNSNNNNHNNDNSNKKKQKKEKIENKNENENNDKKGDDIDEATWNEIVKIANMDNEEDDFNYDVRQEKSDFYCAKCHNLQETIIDGKIQKIQFTNIDCQHVACIACARKHVEREIVTFKKLPTCVICLKNMNQLDMKNLFSPAMCKQLTDHLFKQASLVVPPFRENDIAGAGDLNNDKNDKYRKPVTYVYQNGSDYPSAPQNMKQKKNELFDNEMDNSLLQDEFKYDSMNNKNNNNYMNVDNPTIMVNAMNEMNNNNEKGMANNMIAHANTAEISQMAKLDEKDEMMMNSNVVPPPLMEKDNSYIANELDVNSDNPYVRAQLDDANVMLRILDEQEALRQKASAKDQNAPKSHGNGNGNGNGNESNINEEKEDQNDPNAFYGTCLTESCQKRVKLPSSDHTQLDCPHCGISWCLTCGVEYHAFLTCQDYQEQVRMALLKEQQEMQMQQTKEMDQMARAQTRAQMGNMLNDMPFADENNDDNGNGNDIDNNGISNEEFDAIFGHSVDNDSNKKKENNMNENNNENIMFEHCPTCDIAIEKIGGCNHVTCAQCNTKFCYICGKKVDQNEVENHFDDKEHPLWTKEPLSMDAAKQVETEIEEKEKKAEMERLKQMEQIKLQQMEDDRRQNRRNNDSDDEAAPIVGVGRW